MISGWEINQEACRTSNSLLSPDTALLVRAPYLRVGDISAFEIKDPPGISHYYDRVQTLTASTRK